MVNSCQNIRFSVTESIITLINYFDFQCEFDIKRYYIVTSQKTVVQLTLHSQPISNNKSLLKEIVCNISDNMISPTVVSLFIFLKANFKCKMKPCSLYNSTIYHNPYLKVKLRKLNMTLINMYNVFY